MQTLLLIKKLKLKYKSLTKVLKCKTKKKKRVDRKIGK